MNAQTFHNYVYKLGKGILYGAQWKVFLSIDEICNSFGISEEVLRRDFRITKLAGGKGYNVLIKPIDE